MILPRMLTRLSEVCREHLLTEKWLLAPNLRVGHQWIHCIAMAGGNAVNLRLQTLRGMAAELAGPEMTRRGCAPAPAARAQFLMDQLLAEIHAELEYLRRTPLTPRLSQTVLRSIDAVRLEGLDEQALALDRFEVPEKGRDLIRLATAYRSTLAKKNLLDEADVLRLATQRLRGDKSALPADLLLLAPFDMDFSKVERDLLDAFPQDRFWKLPVDEPIDREHAASATAPTSNLELLRWRSAVDVAPAAPRDGTVAIFHAVGERNEARETLRRLLVDGVSLDDVEILCSDPEIYIPAFYETFAVLDEVERSGDDVPVTFADGVPCSYSRPGRALAGWLRWMSLDHPPSILAELVRDGLLNFPASKVDDENAEPLDASRLAAELRAAKIGVSRERYLPRLEAAKKAVDKLLSAPMHDDEDLEASDRRLRSLTGRRQYLDALTDMVAPLVEGSRKASQSTQGLLEAVVMFLSELARSVDELDNYARKSLVEQVEAARAWTAEDALDPQRVWQWIEELLASTRVMGSGPRPGCVHVASLSSGGHSGRGVLCVVGLDDGRFPSGGAQDALLLDDERRRLSPHLPTSDDRLTRSILAFDRLLARQRGRIVLSFSSLDVAGDRELFASPLMLDAYRLTSGVRAADQAALARGLGSPASFAPAHPEGSLNCSEWWLWKLARTPTPQNADSLRPFFPHLGAGMAAREQRESRQFTEFDGRVEEAGEALDPAGPCGRISSAHSLETIGACPLRYFFRYGLGLEPPEDWDVDPDRWLDALQTGSLCHEVFERFMRMLTADDHLPKFDRDEAKLQAILDEAIERYRQMVPPPSEGVFQRELELLRETMRIFLRDEERNCLQYGLRPAYLEASIGMPADEHGSALDSEKACGLPLSGGRTIRVRGRIDRVDRREVEPTPTYVVWDYKTGGSGRYDQSNPFKQGRVIQPLLYQLIAEKRIREVVDSTAVVDQFGFFFPSYRARGERIVWRTDELQVGAGIIENLASIAGGGAYLATDDAGDCKYCDFRPICGDVYELTAASRLKLVSSQESILQPIKDLRGHGKEEVESAGD